MRVFKWIAIILVALIALFIVIGLLLPSKFYVQKKIIIDAPPERIHVLVGDLERWPEWEPWLEEDPTMVTTIHGESTGEGASQTWTGKSGTGKLTFTKWHPTKGIMYEMSFNEGDYDSLGRIIYEPTDRGTMVTWGWSGELGMNPVSRYFGVMMDSMVGPLFKRGLEKLKNQVEAMPEETMTGDEETGEEMASDTESAEPQGD